MDQYESIRTLHRVYGKSIREIARQTGHHRKTIRKALAGQEPKYRRRKRPHCPVMGPVSEVVAVWLKADRGRPRKQRHTAHRVFQRLVSEHGFAGGESTVRRWVRQYKAQQGWGAAEAVVPLDPEAAREAEVDWGGAWIEMAGERRQVRLFCMRSRFSGLPYVRAYPWERQEMFLDGHMRAFAFYGGVFPTIVYDNLSSAVSKILRGKGRLENERFVSFRSHYTFQARFCNAGQGREKGGVEGLVGFARRNFFVPLPKAGSFQELNEWLERRCLEHGRHRIQGREGDRTVGQRHEQERGRLLALPERPFENCKLVQVRISRYQTARVDRNSYSVPRAWVGRKLIAHVGCEAVALYAQGRQVARHPRLFSNSKWQLDPLHYLELIRQRVGSFDSARPIRQWRAGWPPSYETLLQALRSRLGETRGTREFVEVLLLHERHPKEAVEHAVGEAVARQAFSREAVRQLVSLQEGTGPEPEALPAELMPGVTDRPVPASDTSRYDALLTGGER